MAHVLIVDDDPDVVGRNTDALVTSGHVVSTVYTAAQALAFVQREAPDLVVLEAMLDGGYGGFDLARNLAREFPDLPLIMLTSADQHMSPAEIARQDRDGGWLPVQRYMEKPVMPEVLVYEVEHALEAAAA